MSNNKSTIYARRRHKYIVKGIIQIVRQTVIILLLSFIIQKYAGVSPDSRVYYSIVVIT